MKNKNSYIIYKNSINNYTVTVIFIEVLLSLTKYLLDDFLYKLELDLSILELLYTDA